MDIHRPERARKKKIRRIAYSVLGLAALVLATVALSRLEPAAPGVERETVFLGTVERGEMVRRVRGPGTLVPEEIRWIAAASEGRVDRILVLPGAPVEPDTVLLELSNPELEQQALEAESRLRAAEAGYARLEAQLSSDRLDLEAAAAMIDSEAEQAQLRAEADGRLFDEGLISDLEHELSLLRARELERRAALEAKRLETSERSAEAQLAAESAGLEEARALWRLRRRQLDQLAVTAGIDGVLQRVDVEVGQRVSPGAELARVARPDDLKAELRIPETQAKDVQLGQRVEIDTRNGVVGGRVARIDPAVESGTVTVDVEITGELPRGARPDLSVDGTIEIERLEDVLYVGRPAYGQSESTITLFRLDEQGEEAVRVPVRLGRASVNTIEVVEGLAEGDRVILSDTTAWDEFDRIRLD